MTDDRLDGTTLHLREIRSIKQHYGKHDHCAACGVIRVRLGGDGNDGNGVCCSACLAEYPELQGLSRDEVTLWLYHKHGDSLEVRGTSGQRAAHVARLWLRMQARQGRTDDGKRDESHRKLQPRHLARTSYTARFSSYRRYMRPPQTTGWARYVFSGRLPRSNWLAILNPSGVIATRDMMPRWPRA